ncbi:MAG TPA: ATP-binding protein, partial [Bacillota bacterium]|nr:ATP-binding protein [Bacillota bacterium]
MFHKLKLQFIMTNLTIITFLFVTLTLGAYTLLHIQMINHAEFFAKRVALGIESGVFPGFPDKKGERPQDFQEHPFFHGKRPPGPPPFPRNNFALLHHRPLGLPGPPFGPPPGHDKEVPLVLIVKTNARGSILMNSSTRPLNNSEKTLLFREVVQSENNKGIIRGMRSPYFFYKTSLSKERGTIIVFLDLQHETSMQNRLVLSLLIISFIYLGLSWAGSVFMAKRAIHPIQKAWQQQKDFLADASHELRTPLTVIQTNLEVVLDSPQNTVASQREWLENIQEELQHTSELVSSLLFLARMDSQQYKMNQRVYSLNKLIERAYEAFKPVADKKQIEIRMDMTRDLSCFGDESHMRQVLEILLDNAIRHTPSGGAIVIGLQQVDKRVILSISDTGEGIPAEHLGKIFDRFYQVDSSRSKGKTGLGLSIAKSIVESHGGKILVASQLGQGSTFT